jgi:hypothetical protein
MINYGEDIAYWYLRLNGFFPLSNFVLHRVEKDEHTSDVDLLAIRPPYPFERIGGRVGDRDPWLFDLVGQTGTVGIVCEVKTGEHTEADLFRVEYLRIAVERLGLFPEAEVDAVVDDLADAPLIPRAGVTVAKLLIATKPCRSKRCLQLRLDDAEDFLDRRADRYLDPKVADRMFFPTGVFQFVINRARRRAAEKARAERQLRRRAR